ncbi:MAG: hypothetical protein FGM57_02600 [Candidatus Taylorbacteria bacterium]|nr:hypothetical protein [Candidatus Taylorbacteria bacterium]
MIKLESNSHYQDSPETGHNFERNIGFFDLLGEQDSLNDRIHEIEMQIRSIEIQASRGTPEDVSRKTSLQSELEELKRKLDVNRTRLGEINRPDIAQ